MSGPSKSTSWSQEIESVPATWPRRSSRGRQAVATRPARSASATSSSGACSRQSSRVRSRTGSPVRTTSVTGRRWSKGTSAEGMTIPGCAPTDRPSRSTFRSRSIRPTLAALASSTAGSCSWITRSTSSTVPAAARAWATSAVRPITRADRRVASSWARARRKKRTSPATNRMANAATDELAGPDRRRDRPAPPRSTVVRRPRPRDGHPRTAGPRWRRGPRRRR